MAEALATAADPDQVRDLRLALRALAHAGRQRCSSAVAGASFVLDGRRHAASLPSARWGESRIAQRRSAFHALRKLLTFLAYADPAGPDGPGTPTRASRRSATSRSGRRSPRT